jgi:hypothetical protein
LLRKGLEYISQQPIKPDNRFFLDGDQLKMISDFVIGARVVELRENSRHHNKSFGTGYYNFNEMVFLMHLYRSSSLELLMKY